MIMKVFKLLSVVCMVNVAFCAEQTSQRQAPVYQANAGSVGVSSQQQGPNIIQTQSAADNTFLEFYSRQNTDFSVSVFFKEAGKLVKRDISVDDQQKAVIVFFGEWCPHCDQFLASFGPHISKLTTRGIKIFFICVPPVGGLKNWKDPTMTEYQSAATKITNHGISLSANVRVVMLGSRVVLAKTGIEGLPVVLAVKKSKEKFRGVGKSVTKKMDFTDQAILNQFFEIWEEDESDVPKDVQKGNAQKTHKNAPGRFNGRKSGVSENQSKNKINLEAARIATELLNSPDLCSIRQQPPPPLPQDAPVVQAHEIHNQGCSC
ncbi:MAG: redoxin domain-containing protein [Holosporales bacterium]|jgi:thiol-disulfide isomerase/thioredoxin|nr:redoxin domain-containing protein [Holosporales bacterium]